MALVIAVVAGVAGLLVLARAAWLRRAGATVFGPRPEGELPDTRAALVVAMILWIVLTLIAAAVADRKLTAWTVVAGQIAHVGVAFGVLGAARKRTLKTRLSQRQLVGVGLQAALVAFALVTLTHLALQETYDALGRRLPGQDIIRELQRGGVAAQVVMALCAVTVVPFAEEVVFRGVLLPALAKIMSLQNALVAQAVIFGFIHFWADPARWVLILPIAVIGWILGLVYVRTGSLRAAMVCHAGFNAVNTAMALTG